MSGSALKDSLGDLSGLVDIKLKEHIPRTICDSKSEFGCNTKNVAILVCCTGSVATIKLPQILDQMLKEVSNVSLQVVLTEKAKHFCSLDSYSIPTENIYTDNHWKTWDLKHGSFLQDDLAKKANVLLIAPLDANSMAKIVNGLCDNLLTSLARVWDYNNKIAVCCPAMNTNMWNHPITKIHLEQLHSLGFKIIPPIAKKLACGDFGNGAMAEPESIISEVKRYISE